LEKVVPGKPKRALGGGSKAKETVTASNLKKTYCRAVATPVAAGRPALTRRPKDPGIIPEHQMPSAWGWIPRLMPV